MPMTFISYAQAYNDVLALLPRLPRDLVGVLAIPRSGMLPAYWIATELHLPLGIVGPNEFFGGGRMRSAHGGLQGVKNRPPGTVLVMDDTTHGGGGIRESRQLLRSFPAKYKIQFGSLYVSPGAEHLVNYYSRVVPGPRFFEWNIFQSGVIPNTVMDLDGVLCVDPPVPDRDDPEYQAAIQNAVPLHLPRIKIGMICTNRLERWRGITEDWLRRHGITWGKLVMQTYQTAHERRAAGDYGRWKAQHYLNSGCQLFIESSDAQARRIVELARRPVLSLETKQLYQ
jgi:orotate phosphoribosyltransferase